MIEGKAVYDEEIMDLLKKLKAKGIVLLVINGVRNKKDIEFGSALTLEDVPRIWQALYGVADEFKRDYASIVRRSAKEAH